jgi:ankyrin repeat protein
MKNFNLFKKSIVFICFFAYTNLSVAGAYEDFFKAIESDNVRVVQGLLQRGFDPNTVNPEGIPALVLAVRQAASKVAELLAIQAQTKVELRNDKDESVLMLASLKGYLNLVKKLVEKDADVNKTGWTPLHYAATGGHVAVIEHLLEHSAYIDAESPNGTTPLMMAAMYGTPEAVKALIQAGADPTLQNQLGMSALDFAVQAQRNNSIELMHAGLARWAARHPNAAPSPNIPMGSAQGTR